MYLHLVMLDVALAVAAMAPQHIEVYQIHKKQSIKVTFQPAYCHSHTVAVCFCMVTLC